MRVSRRAGVLGLLTITTLLPACATSTADIEMRRLEARSAYEAGVKSISEGRVSLGLASLRQATEVEPGNALYHNAVGAVLLNVGRYPDAQAEFQKAVELDATYADAYHNLGSTYAEQGKWEEAITAYKKALAQTIYTTPESHVQQPGLCLLGARSSPGSGGGVPRRAPAPAEAGALPLLARGPAATGGQEGRGQGPLQGRQRPGARFHAGKACGRGAEGHGGWWISS